MSQGVSEVREAVENHLSALNNGDLADILETFTADAVFRSTGGVASGRAELAGMFDAVVGSGRPRTILRHADQEGDRLLCTLTRRFAMTDEDGVVRGSHDVDVDVVFTVRDGAIAAVQVAPI